MPWLYGGALAMAQGPLINEVVPGGGTVPDWIEVYNPGPNTIDLRGYALVTTGRTHRIDAAMPIGPGGHHVLWCDRHPEEGPDHLDLKLQREGGSVLLIDPDRRTMRDVYSWQALPSGVSIGRLRDGSREWGYFNEPTPGASNALAHGARRLLAAPVPEIDDNVLTSVPEEGSVLRYTLDGRIPQESSAALDERLVLNAPCIVTLRAFAGDALPSPCVAVTVPREGTTGFIAVRVDPDSLNDAKRGILADDGAANYARTGREWQRDAQAEWHGADSVRREDVRLAVSGSGTRGLPKKNFKLYGERETMLRADATPHAFLRNLFIEAIAKPHARVDIQPSTPRPFYVNGVYQGLYRAMPAKNSAWLQDISGAESVELIDGPGAHALKGDDTRHTLLLGMLERSAPLDSLTALMDVTSLLDLACFDLYTGRADHDLNTRCWRPREKGGRWRWILFDMDLWAPPAERTVDRMCSATAPEAPYLPWLLKHDELRPRLLARLSAWLATSLADDRATVIADSLFTAHAGSMREDYGRWKDVLAMPSPDEGIAALREHIATRPVHLLEQVKERTGQALRKMSVRVVPAHAGEVTIEQLPLTDDERAFTAFSGAPLRFTAQAARGYAFVGWQGTDEKGATITVDPGNVKNLRAVFRLLETGTQ
jgi:hypothetical protein